MSKGFSAYTNRMGLRAIRLHYSASPEKDVNHPDPAVAARAAAWYDRARANYPDVNQWNQEMEIAWWVAAGTRVYPQFSETTHLLDLEGFRERKTIYRAWDFGWHAPACLIAQVDSKDRLVVIKEVIGKEATTREFAQQVIRQCTIWFPDHTSGYQDFCDPAGQKVNATASERSEVRDVEILNKLNIHPKWEYGWSRKDGRSLVHQLLAVRLDGTPSMFVSRQGCPILTQGFLGRYVYPARKDGSAHEEPNENDHPWADIHACMRYLATGLYSTLGLRKPGAPTPSDLRPLAHHGYGVPVRKGGNTHF